MYAAACLLKQSCIFLVYIHLNCFIFFVFFFKPHPCKRAKLSTLEFTLQFLLLLLLLLLSLFWKRTMVFEEWSWYVICLVYYKSEFSQYFCFVLFVPWELCNQSRCLKQSRKRPLWIRENLVHSIFLYVCVRKRGGRVLRGARQQSKYIVLRTLRLYAALRKKKQSKKTEEEAGDNHHTCIHLKSPTFWLLSNDNFTPLMKCKTTAPAADATAVQLSMQCSESLLWKARLAARRSGRDFTIHKHTGFENSHKQQGDKGGQEKRNK